MLNIVRHKDEYVDVQGLHISEGFLVIDQDESRAIVDTINDADILILDKVKNEDRVDSLIRTIHKIFEIYGYKDASYLPCVSKDKIKLVYEIDI